MKHISDMIYYFQQVQDKYGDLPIIGTEYESGDILYTEIYGKILMFKNSPMFLELSFDNTNIENDLIEFLNNNLIAEELG